MSNKLEPCPFCGCEADESLFSYESPWHLPRFFAVVCSDCGAYGAGSSVQKDAVKNWNTRVHLSAVPELVEALNWISTSLNDSDVMREIAKAALAKYKGENTDET